MGHIRPFSHDFFPCVPKRREGIQEKLSDLGKAHSLHIVREILRRRQSVPHVEILIHRGPDPHGIDQRPVQIKNHSLNIFKHLRL